MVRLDELAKRMDAYDGPLAAVSGRVESARSGQRVVTGLSGDAALGDQLLIFHADGPALAEVVAIDSDRLTAVLYERRAAAFVGAEARLLRGATVRPHDRWLGRTIDALARPLDGRGPLPAGPVRSVDAGPPPALCRRPLVKPVRTGVKVVDLFAPLVEGQRMGIFAGSGIGKSTLMAMLSRAEGFDVVVAALTGERGREVRELLDGPLSGVREKTVCVVATSDEAAPQRRLAPMVAMAVAEHFRECGKRVLFLIDSLTRAAHAAREMALAAGEPPVSRGYPPSVFQEMARLLERAGTGEGEGSITALAAVLVDGDDMDEPVADAARGMLDGHIVLSRALFEAGRYPAVDPLASLSRLARVAFRPDEWELSRRLRELIARYEDTRDLRMMAGHNKGFDEELDRAVDLVPRIYEALLQTPSDAPTVDAFAELAQILAARMKSAEPATASA